MKCWSGWRWDCRKFLSWVESRDGGREESNTWSREELAILPLGIPEKHKESAWQRRGPSGIGHLGDLPGKPSHLACAHPRGFPKVGALELWLRRPSVARWQKRTTQPEPLGSFNFWKLSFFVCLCCPFCRWLPSAFWAKLVRYGQKVHSILGRRSGDLFTSAFVSLPSWTFKVIRFLSNHNVVPFPWGQVLEDWKYGLTLLFTSCVTWSELINIHLIPFSHLWNGTNSSATVIVPVCRVFRVKWDSV